MKVAGLLMFGLDDYLEVSGTIARNRRFFRLNMRRAYRVSARYVRRVTLSGFL